MRSLIIFKIPSFEAINIAPALRRGTEVKLEKKEQQEIQHFWDEAERKIEALNLDWSMVRIYQEGIPLARPELITKIIDKSAEQDRNYQIIKKLISKGARLEGAENPDRLFEEYSSFKAFLEAKNVEERKKVVGDYAGIKADLRARRNSFITERINTTLLEGETGILFIRAYHNIESKLQKDIVVKIL